MSDRLNTAVAEAWSNSSAASGAAPGASEQTKTAEGVLLPVVRPVDWSDVAEAQVRSETFEQARVIAGRRRTDHSGAFDLLALRLERICRENGWTRIAVTTPRAGCGGTTVALNLALALGQRGARVLGFDAAGDGKGALDLLGLRKPRSVAITDVEDAEPPVHRLGTSLLLAEARSPSDRAFMRDGGGDPTGGLNALVDRYSPDLTLVDLPSVLRGSDTPLVLGTVDAALLVAGAARSTADDIAQSAQLISEMTTFLGTVLNDASTDGAAY
ncbi:MAG: hypothetical protein AAGD13_09150 [Pseudomonadota bacterium]